MGTPCPASSWNVQNLLMQFKMLCGRLTRRQPNFSRCRRTVMSLSDCSEGVDTRTSTTSGKVVSAFWFSCRPAIGGEKWAVCLLLSSPTRIGSNRLLKTEPSWKTALEMALEYPVVTRKPQSTQYSKQMGRARLWGNTKERTEKKRQHIKNNPH